MIQSYGGTTYFMNNMLNMTSIFNEFDLDYIDIVLTKYNNNKNYKLVYYNKNNIEITLSEIKSLNYDNIVIFSTLYLTEFNKFKCLDTVNFLKSNLFIDNSKFSYNNYSKYVPILNDDFIYYDSILDNYDLYFDNDMFIRPDQDGKPFKSGILNSKQTIESYLKNTWFKYDSPFIVAETKKINSEFRFICSDEKIITGSRYMLNGEFDTSNYIPDEIYNHSEKIRKMYIPSKYFTMDICQTENGIKLVEYNNFNQSGMYECNLYKIIEEFI